MQRQRELDTIDLPPRDTIDPDVTVDLYENAHDAASDHDAENEDVTYEALDEEESLATKDQTSNEPLAVDRMASANASSNVHSARLQARAVALRASLSPAELAPGVMLDARYLIQRLIGGSGASLVWQAIDMQCCAGAVGNAQVAVKTPRPELHDHEPTRLRLSFEYRYTKALLHPNIVRVFELSNSALAYMTMEMLGGKPLSSLLWDGKTLPQAYIYRILEGCALALVHSHQCNVFHGDFKPGNVIITRGENVKIIGFGAGVLPLRKLGGTPAYASPEVLSGETPDPRDDVFSFACVAYELLTGKHPFDRRSSILAREEGCSPPRAPNLSTSQWLALLAALSWRREERCDNFNSLIRALIPEQLESAAPAISAPTIDSNAATPDDPRDLLENIMPPAHSWGFFLFVVCALAIALLASRCQNETASVSSRPPALRVASAALPEHLLGQRFDARLETDKSHKDGPNAGVSMMSTTNGSFQ